MADQPTREQFEAAAKKVAASAPAGLSREDFFALIDKELGRTNPTDFLKQQGGSVLEMSRRGADQATNIKRDVGTSTANTLVKNPMLQSAAHPTSVGDFLSLVIPSGVPTTGVRSFVNLARRTASQAASESKGIPSFIRNFGRIAMENAKGSVVQEMPRPSLRDIPLYEQQQILEETGTRGSTPSGSYRTGEPPVSQPKPKPEVGRLTGRKSETLTDTLQKALDDVGATPLQESRKTLPPEMRTAGEGTLKQSGKFPKRPKQAGGYSSGRPSITPQDYDELLHNSLTERLGMGQANPSAETIGAGPHPDMAAERAAEAEPQAIGGPPASDAPVPSSAESAATSDWPPMEVGRDWHSGAEPGSHDAQLARGLHRDIGDMDAMYRSRTGTTSPLSTIMPDKLGLDQLLAQILGTGWKPPPP